MRGASVSDEKRVVTSAIVPISGIMKVRPSASVVR